MEEQILVDIQIPDDDIVNATKEIGKARAQVEALRAANKELDKSSEAYTKNAVEIKKLNQTISQNERVLIANTKAQEANKGSIEQLRSQLSLVSSQWAKLSKDERENTSAGQALSKQKLQLTNQLKELEKATGDTRRNVGNYSEGMKEALKETGLFSREQQALASVQKVVKATTQAATVSTNAFKVALAATGIGAIVIAFGTLITYLTQTQQGMDFVKRASAGLQAIFSVLIDRVLSFGQGVFKLFTGDIKGAVADLKATFAGLGAEILDEAKAAAELERRLQDVEKAQARLEVTRAKSRATIKELNQIAEDTTKSDLERAQAAQQAINIETDLLTQQIKLRQEALEVRKQQNALGTSTEADLQRERDLEIEIAQLKMESAELQTTLQNKLNTINQQAEAERKKAADDEAKSVEELAKAKEKAAQEELKMMQERSKNLAAVIEEQAQAEINALQKRFNDGLLSREEYNKELENLQLAALETELRLAQATGEGIAEAEGSLLAFKGQLKEKDLEATALVEQQKKEFTQSALGDVAGLFNQQSAAYKAFASAQALINTYQAATAAFAPPPTGAGPILGPIVAAIATAKGLAQVAKINSTNVPKFATGVIGIDGPGSGTSDSIDAKISKGESVITARATSVFAPVLAAMEAAVGNRPNFGLGAKKFATGIINAPVNATRALASSEVRAAESLTSQLQKARIQVSVVEINRVNSEYQRAASFAEVTE